MLTAFRLRAAGLAGAILMVAGCSSGATPPTPTPTPTPTGPPTGSPVPFPVKLFAADSWIYQPLPADTPSDPQSDALVAALKRQTETYFGNEWTPNVDVSTHTWSPPLYVARETDPLVSFTTENCQKKDKGWDADLIKNHLSDVRIPSYAEPDTSSDAPFAVYNADTGRLVETWVTKKHEDGTWSACWGGSIDRVSTSNGQFEVPYGVSATGLAHSAYAIRPEELHAGRIEHVIGLGIPEVKAGVVSWPATRSDGTFGGQALAEGQRLRFPADLDLDSYKLSPVARTIAKAAQEYGIVIMDTSGSVTFTAQNQVSAVPGAYDQVFRGDWAINEMNGRQAEGEDRFPIEKLEVLPLNYGKPKR